MPRTQKYATFHNIYLTTLKVQTVYRYCSKLYIKIAIIETISSMHSLKFRGDTFQTFEQNNGRRLP